MIDIDAIRRANSLPEVVNRFVSLKARGAEWVACCPFHAERTPSFTIFNGGQRFHCFGCGATGDVLDFIQQVYGVSLSEAAQMLEGGRCASVSQPNTPSAKADRIVEARQLWDAAVSAAGTLAEAYLNTRGITLAVPEAIRFAFLPYGKSGALPCLIAAVRDLRGSLIGIQRIFLAADGKAKAAVSKPKLSLGKVRGGAIRFGEFDASDTLVVCEGPEDGLSLVQMLGLPVWVAAGATMLPGMEFPKNIRTVVIAADNDPAGDEAARKAASAFTERGLTVRIIKPLPAYKDFNDELRGRSHE